MTDTTELRKLEQAATKGPWVSDTDLELKAEGIIEGPGGGAVAMAFPFANVNTVARHGGRSFNFADADFIVAARNALPGLLDELDRLREDRDRLAADNARLRAAIEEGRPFVTPSVDLLLRKFNDIDGTDSKTREIIREIEEVRSRIDEALAPREEG